MAYSTEVVREGCILNDVEANFVISLIVSEFPAEPYSWGGSRGTETEVDVTGARLLDWLDEDDVIKSREVAIETFGADEVRDAELRARACFDPCSLTEMEMAA